MNTFLASFKGKISPNAAYGMVVLAFLLGVVMVSSVREQVLQSRADTVFAARELAKLNSIDNTDLWAKRAKESGDVLAQWQSIKWQGETVGVLAAKIQQKLIQLAKDMELKNPRVDVGNELIEVDGETIMRFNLVGTANNTIALVELLTAVSEGEKAIIIDEIIADYYQNQRSLVRLSGLALVQVASDSTQVGTAR